MTTPYHIKDIFLKLISNFTKDEIIITGGIADMYNFNHNKVVVDLDVSDVDIYISDKNMLNKIEVLFNNLVTLIEDEANIHKTEKIFTVNGDIISTQYYLWVDEETHFDIFLIQNIEDFKAIKTKIYKYGGQDFSCVDYHDRYNQLKRTINNKHSGVEPLDGKIFKYLRKIIRYKDMINEL